MVAALVGTVAIHAEVEDARANVKSFGLSEPTANPVLNDTSVATPSLSTATTTTVAFWPSATSDRAGVTDAVEAVKLVAIEL
jgi:hypothetical protein